MKCSQASLDRHIPAATPKPAGAIDQGVFLRLMAWKKFREFCFTWFSCCAKCVPSRFTCSRTASDLRSELVLSSWLPERSYHSSEPYSCGNAASFLKVMQVRHCIHQVWPFRLHFDTLSTENDVSEKHRVWKKHTPTNTVKKNWYTYMCQDLHLHSLYTINILYHTPQTTQIYFLHAPACTCIHLKHPRPILEIRYT